MWPSQSLKRHQQWRVISALQGHFPSRSHVQSKGLKRSGSSEACKKSSAEHSINNWLNVMFARLQSDMTTSKTFFPRIFSIIKEMPASLSLTRDITTLSQNRNKHIFRRKSDKITFQFYFRCLIKMGWNALFQNAHQMALKNFWDPSYLGYLRNP